MELEKIKSLFLDFENTTVSLEEALAFESTDINIDGTIQRFEFTFELAWKLIHAIATYQGKEEEARNPRNAFRYGTYVKLIDDVESWFGFLNARNSTVHLYNKAASRKVYNQIKAFPILAKKLISEVKKEFSF